MAEPTIEECVALLQRLPFELSIGIIALFAELDPIQVQSELKKRSHVELRAMQSIGLLCNLHRRPDSDAPIHVVDPDVLLAVAETARNICFEVVARHPDTVESCLRTYASVVGDINYD